MNDRTSNPAGGKVGKLDHFAQRPKSLPHDDAQALRLYSTSQCMRAIINRGGTLLIGARRDSQFRLPADWPYDRSQMSIYQCVRDMSAHDKLVSDLLTHTISVAEAAIALGKPESAIVNALKHGALGGVRVKGIWFASKKSVEAAAQDAKEGERGAA